MKLPLKLEYACRVLIQLKPTFVSKEVRRVEELAELEQISPNYLVQILKDLRHHGLVRSERGKNGGYTLLMNPEEITLYDIVRATEGHLLQVNGDEDGESGHATVELWRAVFAKIEEELKSHRLADMGEDGAGPMYHI